MTAYSETEVEALAVAMWQLLDDMGPGNEWRSVCLAAKAQARIAFEPFLEEVIGDSIGLMPLDEAIEIVRNLK